MSDVTRLSPQKFRTSGHVTDSIFFSDESSDLEVCPPALEFFWSYAWAEI